MRLCVRSVIAMLLLVLPFFLSVSDLFSRPFAFFMQTEVGQLQQGTEFEFYTRVHDATFPAEKAGKWVYSQSGSVRPSKDHLLCLDQERQENCHDEDAWKKSNDTAKLSRRNAMKEKAVQNSPGILSADDPWIWESKHLQYRALAFDDRNLYIKQVGKALRDRVIYLVGDSLTRQWAQVMRCELIHVLGMSPEDAMRKINYVQVHNGVGDIRANASF